MKKIIAFSAVLAVASAVFAQSVTITNTLSSTPVVNVDGGNSAWGFDESNIFREEIVGTGKTAGNRAAVWVRARLDVETRDAADVSIMNVKTHWLFTNDLCAAAVVKPFENLEIKVGSKNGLNKHFGPEIAWKQSNVAKIAISGVTGSREGIHGFNSGIYAGFTGIDGLWLGFGFVTGWGENSTEGKGLIKKGAYGPFQFGATYDAKLFSVGAKYLGQIGGYNEGKGSLANGVANNFTDAKYAHHNIYAGFTFKGLKDAKIGTTIGAAVDFDTHNASEIMGTKEYIALAVSANAGMNFRNGITDSLAVTVVYQSVDGKKTKVLPLYIGNTLGYKVSGNATFSLITSYTQGGLEKSVKAYSDAETKDSDVISGKYASVITLKPSLSLLMGAHTFGFGAEAQIANQMKYYQETSSMWGFTSLSGKAVRVKFPVSWSYKF